MLTLKLPIMPSPAGDALKFATVDVVLDFALFPVWWYTAGFVRVVRAAANWFEQTRRMMAVGLWAKNILTPMFAQYDFAGRAISVLMRLVNIIGRALGLVFFGFAILAALALYLVFPIALALLVVFQAWRVLAA